MSFKKASKFLIVQSIIVVLILALSFTIIVSDNIGNIVNASNSLIYEPNTQVYTLDNGQENTIYWAQGITPPKMAADNDPLLGTDGYFSKVTNKDSSYYEYPMVSNHGYFDFNKGFYGYDIHKNHHCYLAAAINLIEWWMTQNSPYINSYLSHIKNNDGVYVQNEKLKPIDYESTNWDSYTAQPELTLMNANNQTYYSQELLENPIYKDLMGAYKSRDKGYFPDFVMDFFINGYNPIQVAPGTMEDDPNQEASFDGNKLGGLFYPIFNKEILTKRENKRPYEFYKNFFKDAFNNGKGVILSHGTPSTAAKNSSHAITIWGAEYDGMGELVRLYYTDSDDYDPAYIVPNTNTVRGMNSYNVRQNDKGGLILDNWYDEGKGSAEILAYITLDLKREVWQEKGKDAKDVPSPILKPLSDKGYSRTDIDIKPIEVIIENKNTSYYEYQWYESESNGGVGKLIEGANKNRYVPEKPKDTPKYYYCEVTSNLNGKKLAPVKSTYAKIFIDEKIVDAIRPTVVYLNTESRKDFTQYGTPPYYEVSVVPKDEGTITYQWYHKVGMDISPTGGTPLEGETNPRLYVDILWNYTGNYERHVYYCVVTNTNTNVNGIQVVTTSPIKNVPKIEIIYPGTLANAYAPDIVHNPKISKTKYKVGETVETLNIHAKTLDNGQITYQWYENDEPILYATGKSFTPNPSGIGKYTYYCKVNNHNDNAENSKDAVKTSNSIVIDILGDEVPSSDANLSELGVENQTIKPTFNSNVLNYTLTVPNNIQSVNITGTRSDLKASVVGLGKHDLDVGINHIEIVVTAEDNVTKKTYRISITREESPHVPSSDAKLSNLSISGVTLVPNFSSTTYLYQATVANSVTSVTITPTLSDSKASKEIIGNYNNLAVGKNTITIKVTAEDKSVQNYVVEITREDVPSGNNDLKSLKVVGYEIQFDKDTLAYNITVKNSVTSVTVNATKDDEKASVVINYPESLVVGKNVITIVVKAENGEEKTYTINVTKEDVPSSDNKLSNLSISGVTLVPNFSSTTYLYTATVANNVTSVTITPTLSSTKAKVEITGNYNDLAVGKNTITIKVTAEDTSVQNYVVEITREDVPYVPSSDNKLSNLSISGVTLVPNFSSTTYLYTATVANNVTSVTITPTLSSTMAKVEITGNYNDLAVGKNTITIKVTAEDKSVQNYVVEITREDVPYVPSGNNYLNSLEVVGYELSFNKDTLEYSITVKNSVTSVIINAIKADPKATITIPNATNLQVGNNVFEIVVKAENGDKKTYTINVIREKSELNGFTVNGDAFAIFDNNTLEYTFDVPYDYSYIEIKCDLQEGAKVSVYGAGKLVAGKKNMVQIKVTNSNGTKTEYRLFINRAGKPVIDNTIEESKEFPIWAGVLIGVLGVIIIVSVVLAVVLVNKHKKEE